MRSIKLSKATLAIFMGLFLILLVGAGCSSEKEVVKKAEPPATAGVMKGNQLIPFEVIDLAGKPFKVESKGKPMVINFWATWCPPCVEEMPELQKFSEKNPQVDLRLVSIQEDSETVADFLKEQNLKLKPILDSSGKIAQQYRISAIPTTLVVNAQGVIIYRKTGPVTASELEKVLK